MSDGIEMDASDFGFEDSSSDTSTGSPSDTTQAPPSAEGQEQQTGVEGEAPPNATPTTEQMFNLRYNHEDRQVPLNELLSLGQKGLNYDKLQERLSSYESDPRIQFVDELSSQHGMTFDQFIESFRQEQIQGQIDELIQNNIPPEYAEEMVRNREFREKLEAEQRAREEKEMQDRDFMDFFNTFKQLHGRDFDAQKDNDDIPQEVWQANEQGVPFKYAYLEHFVNKLQVENQVLRQNKKNSETSPVGSLNAFGQNDVGGEDEFLIGFNSV